MKLSNILVERLHPLDAESLVCDLTIPDFTVGRDSAQIQTAIDEAIKYGGNVQLAAGIPLIDKTLLIDNRQQKDWMNKVGLIGTGISTTMLLNKTWDQAALHLIGTDPQNPGMNSWDRTEIGGFTVMTGSNQDVGFEIQDVAFLRVRDLQLYGGKTCMRLKGVQTTQFDRLVTLWPADTGILVEGDEWTPCNNLSFYNCAFSGRKYAMKGTFAGLGLYHQDMEGTGIEGDMESGGLDLYFGAANPTVQQPLAPGVGLTLSGKWVEANTGGYAIRLTNLSDGPIVHAILNTCFIRNFGPGYDPNYPNGLFPQHEIIVRNPNGGSTTLILSGCSFSGYNGYVPSPDRTYIDIDSRTKIIGAETCVWDSKMECANIPGAEGWKT